MTNLNLFKLYLFEAPAAGDGPVTCDWEGPLHFKYRCGGSQMKVNKYLFGEMTWPEIKQVIKEERVAVVPEIGRAHV